MADLLASLEAPISGAVASLTEGASYDLAVERPADAAFGDYSTSVALRLAPVLKRAPRQIAEEIAERLRGGGDFASVEVAGPGFVNVRLGPEWFHRTLKAILDQGARYGAGVKAEPESVLVEFVSANPTGLLTLGSARNAAYGDAVARLLRFSGEEVLTEYYFNDAGTQIERFAASVKAAKLGEEMPEDGYAGPEVAELAEALELGADDDLAAWAAAAVPAMFERIKTTLARLRVDFDIWFSERELHDSGAVQQAIDDCARQGFVFEEDGATWLRTTAFGDDKDRVILRAGGQPTYFAADLAYLGFKFRRGSERLLYVLGADHHGYVGRLKAAAGCLGHDVSKVEVLLYQMITVSGERMGKRRGNVVLADELVDAVGVDAARYFLVQRSHDQGMDIDADLAAEQSQKNPVFYVQYAHARACSILRKAADEPIELPARGAWQYAPEPEETALVKRLVEWPAVAAEAAERRAPHRIVAWMHELAADFHSFHHAHFVMTDDAAARGFRLGLVEATAATLKSALGLIGVEAPEQM